MSKVKLVPGRSITGDANITHPKGDILNVKAFYEQDSHIIPDELKEVHVSITEGVDNVWFEYAPTDLSDGENPPLIISFHGGGQSGYGQCYATSWVLLADKYRFVTVFPTASNGRGWNIDPEGPDFRLVDEIIRQMTERYHIDTGRIFIQGMSSGNMMTTALSRNCPICFAGAGMSAGPDSVDLVADPNFDLSPFSPIPVYQSRGERDTMCPVTVTQYVSDRYELNKADREFWMAINGCDFFPSAIRIQGRNNLMVFPGKGADVYFRDVKYRGHGQTIDDAEQMWRQYFSACRRNEDGSLTFKEPLEPVKGDEAIILADGCQNILINGEKAALDAPVYEITEVMEIPPALAERNPELTKNPYRYGPFTYVPLSFMEKAFGFTVEKTYDGHGAVLTSSCGKLKIEVADGNVACTYNDVLRNMERQAEYKDGVLFIPVKDFAEAFGKTVIYHDGVLYITDHAGEMTNDFAKMLKALLQ